MTRKRKSTSVRPFFSSEFAMLPEALQEVISSIGKERVDSGESEVPSVNDCIVADGIAVVPVCGMMVQKTVTIDTWFSCFTLIGCDDLAELVKDLADRRDIETVIIEFDTPGGQIAGVSKLADAVAMCSSQKRVIGVVNELAASAGLWVASQCNEIVIPDVGQIGSLGAFRLHYDDTKMLQELGVEKSVIYRGKYKAAHERPLDEAGRADIQRQVDVTYSLFVEAVASGRGRSIDYTLRTWGDAQVFKGVEAVSNGLADRIGTLQGVLDELTTGPVALDYCGPATLSGDPEQMKVTTEGQICTVAGKPVGALSDLVKSLTEEQVAEHFGDRIKTAVDSAVDAAKAEAAKTLESAVEKAVASATKRLTDLIEAVGAESAVDAFSKNLTVDQAKAGQADVLKTQMAEKDKDLAKLQAELAEARKSPGVPFAASDDQGAAKPAPEKPADGRTEFAADWDKNLDKCQVEFPSERIYARWRRKQVAATN